MISRPADRMTMDDIHHYSWHAILPKASRGKFWAILNPGEFNIKEHVAIVIMASTASSSALAISVFAAEDLCELNGSISLHFFAFNLITTHFNA
jgi:hypothetical protein